MFTEDVTAVAKLDLTGEEPTPAADPVITKDPQERSRLDFELHGWKPQLKVHYSVEGPTSWAPLYLALVLLLAPAAVVLTNVLLPPGATWITVVAVAAGSQLVVLSGGAALLLLWIKIRKR